MQFQLETLCAGPGGREWVLNTPCSWKHCSLLPVIFNFSGRRRAALLTPVSCVRGEDWWHGALTAFLEQAEWSGCLDTACDTGIFLSFPWWVTLRVLLAGGQCWSLVWDQSSAKVWCPSFSSSGCLLATSVLCRPAGELRGWGCSWEWLPRWMLLPRSFLQMSLM